jgi:hypothetical protein
MLFELVAVGIEWKACEHEILFVVAEKKQKSCNEDGSVSIKVSTFVGICCMLAIFGTTKTAIQILIKLES